MSLEFLIHVKYWPHTHCKVSGVRAAFKSFCVCMGHDSLPKLRRMMNLVCLVFSIFDKSNIKATKDSLCPAILTVPQSPEASCVVYVCEGSFTPITITIKITQRN